MTGLLCSIGCFIVAFVTKDKLMLAIAAIFYLGWQICVLGSTISNKKKSDDLPERCGNIILKPIEVDAINRDVTVCRDMSDGTKIFIRKQRQGEECK